MTATSLTIPGNGPNALGPSSVNSPAKPRPTLDYRLTSVRRYVTFGMLTVVGLVGGMTLWAAMTDLAGAVIAPGTVVVAGNVKKVQHPSGGVISQILVKNGDAVKAGDVLVRLDETVTRASLQVITKQIDELNGRLARLKAERDDAPSVKFAGELLARINEPDIAQIVSGEQKLFETRVGNRTSQKQQLGQQIIGLQEQIAGNTSQAASKAKETELIKKELVGLEELEAKQLVLTTKMTQMRREQARIEGDMAQLRAEAGQNKGKIAEIELRRLSIDSEAKSDVIKELRETQGKIAELTERRTAAEDQLKRIDIRSPADGIVYQMTVFTVGGVINTAEPLMMIAPQDDQLVVEAKIAPHDIDQARSHTEATLRFPAFNQRTTPSLTGHVISISAELTHEQQTNQSWYVAEVKIDDSEADKLKKLKLVPGMPAEVQIRTDARSALSYLVKPLADQFSKAFKER